MSELATHDLYARTLEIQAQLLAPHSKLILSSLNDLKSAKRILEIGCGPGSQIPVLAEFLSHKSYLGIDISENFILIAKSNFSHLTSLSFECQDVMTFIPSQPFDFILCFAVFQHLSNVDEALIKINQFLTKKGIIAICDTNEQDEFISWPHLPELKKMYHSLTDESTGGKRKSQCLEQIKKLAPKIGLQIHLYNQNDTTLKSSEDKALFVSYIKNAVTLVQHFYQIKLNQVQIWHELSVWESDPNSWVKLTGDSWLILRK